MRILLTNDDGIYAPGLAAIREELLKIGDVEVAAPSSEQSGVGLSVTFLHPIMVEEEKRNGEHWGWAVAGSPVDCVKLGILQFCDPAPDLVVSGINAGMNAGINVLYSGTVAGAIEGAFFDVPSIAVSACTNSPPDYPQAAKWAVKLIREMWEHGLSPRELWNINIPENRPDYPKGVKLTTLSVHRSNDVMKRREDPRGRPYYWNSWDGLDPLQDKRLTSGTDVRELAEGYITLTPLKFDITDYEAVEQSRDWTSRLSKTLED
ncbi:MAG: 5'/3'-nucleotidase SurE [Planctomycetaceae bacterium]